jgi:LPXTG-motif cell wall-anchored protein
VAVQLPKTGPGSTNTMLALGALLLLVGGVMVLSTRREHGVV